MAVAYLLLLLLLVLLLLFVLLVLVLLMRLVFEEAWWGLDRGHGMQGDCTGAEHVRHVVVGLDGSLCAHTHQGHLPLPSAAAALLLSMLLLLMLLMLMF